MVEDEAGLQIISVMLIDLVLSLHHSLAERFAVLKEFFEGQSGHPIERDPQQGEDVVHDGRVLLGGVEEVVEEVLAAEVVPIGVEVDALVLVHRL